VIYVEDLNQAGLVVDGVADPVFATLGSPLPLEGLSEGCADSVRVLAEGAANELEAGPSDGLG
jgi:hypothetical protein